jgi:cell division protein FtsX
MRRSSALILVVVASACGAAGREAAPLKCVVRVYFCTDTTCNAPATKPQEAAARRRLSARDDVWSVRFVSKAAALRQMKRRHPAEVAALPSNPFPDALRVRPIKGADRAAIAAAVPAGRGGVERVLFARDTTCAGN